MSTSRWPLLALLLPSLVAGACGEDDPTPSPGNSAAGSSNESPDGGEDEPDATLSCPANSKACDSECVPLTDPQTGCAATRCTPCFFANASARCDENGACAFDTCAAGYEDCDDDAQNGCETNLMDDLNNCHACGNVCLFDHGDGACLPNTGCTLLQCDPGWGNCSAAGDAGSAGDATTLGTGDACETDFTTLTNCGACGVACLGDDICRHNDILGGYECTPSPNASDAGDAAASDAGDAG